MSALILSLSTATDITSVALHRSGELLLTLSCYKPRATSELLPQMVANLFRQANQAPADLNAVAITGGPGSYTGLRIGTAFAKGLCVAQQLPLIPLSTLEVLCHSAHLLPLAPRTVQYALLDARRSHVYVCLMDHRGQVIQDTQVCHITQLDWEATKGYDQVYLIGSGATYAPRLNLDSRCILMEEVKPQASAMGRLAHQKWLSQRRISLAGYEPIYLSALGAYLPKRPKPR